MTLEEYYQTVNPTQRLYNAERETMFWMQSERFDTRDDAWSWLCAIHDSDVYRRKIRLALPLLKFVEPLDEWEACYIPHHPEALTAVIEMGSGRSEAVLLHEFAHHVAWCKYGRPGLGHEAYFAGTYLRLVYHFHSREAAQDLQASFDRHRVSYGA